MGRRAAGIVAGVVLCVGGATFVGAVEAQAPPDLTVQLNVNAADPTTLLEGLTIELFPDTGQALTPCDTPTAAFTEPLFAAGSVGCAGIASGTYQIGVDGLPNGATATAVCFTLTPGERIDGEFTSVTIGNGPVQCDIEVVLPAVFVDKVVANGTAAVGDFSIEVYPQAGGAAIATATDPSAGVCDDNLDNCAAISLGAGDYRLGESLLPGYLTDNVGCVEIPTVPAQQLSIFPAGTGEFTLGADVFGQTSPFVYCEITNRYYEGSLVVRKVVVNDDGGGTATASDFTAEIYREGPGTLQASAACAADGSCLDVDLPIGPYRIGEQGPAGYTASVACSVTVQPDGPTGIGTTPPGVPDPFPVLNEAIAGDAALAQVEPFGEVTCVLTNDDIATTTTTTTTIAPTTSDAGGQPAAPTTVSPTLPRTGTGDANGMLAAVALGLVALGGGLLAVRRR